MSARALPHDSAAAPRRRNRFVQWLDELVIRITDRAPSNRVLVSVLVVSLLTLVFMGLTGKPRGTTAPIDGVEAPVASVGVESRAAPATAAGPREEGRFAPSMAAQPPAGSNSGTTAAAALPIDPASASPQRADVRSVGAPRVTADAPPRVIDMVRSDPPPPQIAAEIVRAEPAPPRVADAPRTEASVGSTSRAPMESTVSFPPPVRARDVAEAAPTRDARPAERTTFDPSLNPGL